MANSRVVQSCWQQEIATINERMITIDSTKSRQLQSYKAVSIIMRYTKYQYVCAVSEFSLKNEPPICWSFGRPRFVLANTIRVFNQSEKGKKNTSFEWGTTFPRPCLWFQWEGPKRFVLCHNALVAQSWHYYTIVNYSERLKDDS